jgi:hypothetical protein
LELPYEIKLTQIYIITDWTPVKTLYPCGVVNGVVRLLAPALGASGKTDTFNITTDKYASKLFMVLSGNQFPQDGHTRSTLTELSFEGTLRSPLRYPLYVNTTSVLNDSVSIGTSDAQGYALYVSGNSYTTGTATSSDNRIKHNEKTIENALGTICKLQPKHYYKTTELYDENHNFNFDNSGNIVDICGNILSIPPQECGFIAQEVESIPELSFAVHKGSNTTPYGIDYNSIFTRSIKAIQELNTKMEQEDNTIFDLEKQIADLTSRINSIK